MASKSTKSTKSTINLTFVLLISGCATFETSSRSNISRTVVQEAIADSKNESLPVDYRIGRLQRAGASCVEDSRQKDETIKELMKKNDALIKTILKLSIANDSTSRIKYLSVLGVVFLLVLGFGIFKFF